MSNLVPPTKVLQPAKPLVQLTYIVFLTTEALEGGILGVQAVESDYLTLNPDCHLIAP